MKKNCLFIFVFYISICFAQEHNYCLYPTDIVSDAFKNGNVNIFIEGDYLISFQLYNNSIEKFGTDTSEYITKICKKFDSSYEYINYEKDNEEYYRYILEGKEIFVNLNYRESETKRIKLSPEKIKERSNFINHKTGKVRYEFYADMHGLCEYYIMDDGIDKIYSSSQLKEGNTIYIAQNLKDRLYVETTDEPWGICYDYITPPWVEGVPGYGIGEYLDVDFKYKSNELQILNGFVDFDRMHLYKENSRVKKILIESESPKFAKEYNLEDVVKYNLITLPEATDKIRITIKDVYNGDKYDDTCLSSIVVTDPGKPSFEEQKEKIIQILKDGGVWEQLEEFKKKEESK